MSKPALTIVLSAQPNPDFAPASHRGSVQIDAHEVEVASIGEAIRLFMEFVSAHDLGAGNLTGDAGLIKRDGQPLARVALNGTIWQVDSAGKDTGRQYTRPRFSDVGQIVRYLRESADLTRNEMSDATEVAASTIRNLETGRHTASAWTWRKLLAHPALQDFPRIAQESGLEMPIEGPGGSGSGGPGSESGGSGGTPGGEHGGTPGGEHGGTPGHHHGGGADDDGDGGDGDTEGSGGRT